MKSLPRLSAMPAMVLFCLLTAGSLLLGMMTTSGQQWEAQSRQGVARSYEIRSDVQSLFSAVEDAETGQRGYLLTQRPEFLQRYTSAVQHVQSLRGDILGEIAKDPALRRDFDRLQGLVDLRMENLALAVAVNARQGPAAAAALVASSDGSARMSDVRGAVDQMSRAEAARLALRTADAANHRLQRRLLQLAVLLGILSAIGAALWRDNRLRTAQAAILAHANEAAARQTAIFDGAMDTIITLNPRGGIEMINAAGVRLFGYEAQDLLKRDISSVIVPSLDAQDAFLTPTWGAPAPGDGVIRELTARHASGRLIPVDVSVRFMDLSDGTHLVAVVRDVSERRRVDALKDSFIATASHELRTPLTSIAGSLGLLRGGAGGRLPANAMRLVQIAEANGRRLVRLVNDILDIEKIQSGTPFNKAPLQVKFLVETACEAMSGLAAEHLVSLTADEVGDDLWIEADHDRMMQVMGNLLSNAIKASSRDDAVRVAVQLREAGCRILVIDRGAGVPAAFRDKIFERFAQADPADGRGVNGTGLGLSIAQAIIARHEGSIGFDSPPGQGASFFVDLPLITPPKARKPRRAPTLDDHALARPRPEPRLMAASHTLQAEEQR